MILTTFIWFAYFLSLKHNLVLRVLSNYDCEPKWSPGRELALSILRAYGVMGVCIVYTIDNQRHGLETQAKFWRHIHDMAWYPLFLNPVTSLRIYFSIFNLHILNTNGNFYALTTFKTPFRKSKAENQNSILVFSLTDRKYGKDFHRNIQEGQKVYDRQGLKCW